MGPTAPTRPKSQAPDTSHKRQVTRQKRYETTDDNTQKASTSIFCIFDAVRAMWNNTDPQRSLWSHAEAYGTIYGTMCDPSRTLRCLYNNITCCYEAILPWPYTGQFYELWWVKMVIFFNEWSSTLYVPIDVPECNKVATIRSNSDIAQTSCIHKYSLSTW